MGKGTETPAAPDLMGLAKKQQKLSEAAWNANNQNNRVNQTNPYGSLTWGKDANGNPVQNMQLSDNQQNIFNSQEQNQQGLADMTNQLRNNVGTDKIDLGGAPGMPTVGGYNQDVINTMNSLQQPGLQQARSSKEAQMAAMGLGTGSGRAWENEQRGLGDNENRSRLNSVLAGYTQGNTEFGQGMQAHQQGVSDILEQQKANTGKLGTIMGMQQQAGNPQFADYYKSNPYQVADLVGAAQGQYQMGLDKTNARNADSSALWSGLGSLANTGLSAAITKGIF
jgi:hypothetical protein